jgi:Nucleotidyltransferase of unknown function (DUF6036)
LRRFDRSQAITFLHVLDAYLTRDVDVFVVGGMAAILGYHADVKTADIDVYEGPRGEAAAADLQQAARRAREATGIDLSIGGAPVTELPYDYEDRAKELRGVKFRKLTVTVPDKYDLILSKAVRAYPHDLDAIRSIHEHHRCSEKILARRFETEIWKVATTNPRTFALNMVAVMQVLYGEARARFYEKKWLGAG